MYDNPDIKGVTLTRILGVLTAAATATPDTNDPAEVLAYCECLALIDVVTATISRRTSNTAGAVKNRRKARR